MSLRLEQVGIADLKTRLTTLLKGLPPADQRVLELLNRRKAAYVAARSKLDAGRGEKVFAKTCASCHQLKGEGARVGPQLDGIGLRGVDRLLEDTLDPNRNVDQFFRATTIATKDGQSFSGLLLREEGEVLILADAQGKEVRVEKDKVEERSSSLLSPMPANLSEQVNEQDYLDLLAYLLEQRAEPAKK